jgi:hypothetical protein
MKKYCPTCGKPNPAAAKYCCSCGESMSLQKKQPLKKAASSLVLDDEDEEGTEETFNSQATSLDIDVNMFNQNSETFGQIAQGGPAHPGETYQREGGPSMSQEEFLKEFQKEAGSLRDKGK